VITAPEATVRGDAVTEYIVDEGGGGKGEGEGCVLVVDEVVLEEDVDEVELVEDGDEVAALVTVIDGLLNASV